MVEYGVTDEGFVIKTYNEILNEMKIQAKLQFGSEIDLTDTSPLLKFIQTTALEIYKVWEMAESLYYSGFVDTATGESLDKVVKLLGVIRQPAVKATGIVRFTGTNGTVVNEGIRVSTTGGVQFITTETGTIAGGYADVAVEAILYGTIGNVYASTITLLLDNITGVSSITNPGETSGGEEIEDDSSLRYRTALALEQAGKATLAAIEAAILAVPGVTKVSVSENLTTHQVTAIVKGLTYPNDDVTAAIEDTRAAGIYATWANPTGVNIYVNTTVACTNEPADAATLIENKILEYINSLDIGDDVIYSKLFDVIFNEFDWVDDVSSLTLDTVSPPVGTSNIVISSTQEAQSDAAKIGVTIT